LKRIAAHTVPELLAFSHCVKFVVFAITILNKVLEQKNNATTKEENI